MQAEIVPSKNNLPSTRESAEAQMTDTRCLAIKDKFYMKKYHLELG